MAGVPKDWADRVKAAQTPKKKSAPKAGSKGKK